MQPTHSPACCYQLGSGSFINFENNIVIATLKRVALGFFFLEVDIE